MKVIETDIPDVLTIESVSLAITHRPPILFADLESE